ARRKCLAPRAAPAPRRAASAPAGYAAEAGGMCWRSLAGRDPAHISSEAVAAAPDRLNQARIAAVDLDLAAQAADLIVHGAIEQMGLPPLHHVQKPIPVQHLARM